MGNAMSVRRSARRAGGTAHNLDGPPVVVSIEAGRSRAAARSAPADRLLDALRNGSYLKGRLGIVRCPVACNVVGVQGARGKFRLAYAATLLSDQRRHAQNVTERHQPELAERDADDAED
jgi:hypothetical protein